MLIVESILQNNRKVSFINLYDYNINLSVYVRDTESDEVWLEKDWRFKNILGITNDYIITVNKTFLTALDYMTYIKYYTLPKSKMPLMRPTLPVVMINNKKCEFKLISLIDGFQISAGLNDECVYILEGTIKVIGTENVFISIESSWTNKKVAMDIYKFLYNLVLVNMNYLNLDNILIHNTKLDNNDNIGVIDIGLSNSLKKFIIKENFKR